MAASCSVLTSRPSLTTVPFHQATQVNIPKAKKSFCKKCKNHAPHKVTQYKTGKAATRRVSLYPREYNTHRRVPEPRLCLEATDANSSTDFS